MAEIFGHVLGASADHAPLVVPLLVYGFVVECVADFRRGLVRFFEGAEL